MNHLMRELAPIADEAWEQIDDEASRSIKHFLAGRKLVDFTGPRGWSHSAIDVGRIEPLDRGPLDGVEVAVRKVTPLIEVRSVFSLDRVELAAAERGATNIDLAAVIAAGRAAALAEDHMVFHGYEPGGIVGMAAASPHGAVAISNDYSHYPEHVAQAVATLRAADVAGPYAIALGARCFTGVTETTEHGGYPVFEHIRQILAGPIVWAPGVDGAVVLSQRGGDFELTIGEDFSIGYRSSDAASIDLYIEESLSFRINTPEAAVHLAYL
ncbi:MAG TPA: family 1 encapsulin nanocompartment shell protein [Acidimicrobiales bacterium]